MRGLDQECRVTPWRQTPPSITSSEDVLHSLLQTSCTTTNITSLVVTGDCHCTGGGVVVHKIFISLFSVSQNSTSQNCLSLKTWADYTERQQRHRNIINILPSSFTDKPGTLCYCCCCCCCDGDHDGTEDRVEREADLYSVQSVQYLQRAYSELRPAVAKQQPVNIL